MIQPHAFQLRFIFLVSLVLVILVNVIIFFTSSSPNITNVFSFRPYNGSLYRLQDGNNSNGHLNDRKYTIVIFNTPNWLNYDHNKYLSRTCAYRNCRTITDIANLRHQSAIVFVVTAAPTLPMKPPISPSNRSQDQVWIFMWMEAPIRHKGIWAVYKNRHWRNTPNWTVSFSENADIVHPLGYVRKRKPPAKNYSEIFHRKTKMVAWVVSNCKTNSRREEYVRILQENGITVDMYGRCADKSVEEKKRLRLIDKQYKFYLAFENSFCKDYITEKFYRNFNLDVILIVRGGGNYTKLLPSNAYINTADFASIKDLAVHLKAVSNNEQRYTAYLRNKDGYKSIPELVGKGDIFCEICEKLNNLDNNRKAYTNLINTIHKDTCMEPTDLDSDVS